MENGEEKNNQMENGEVKDDQMENGEEKNNQMENGEVKDDQMEKVSWDRWIYLIYIQFNKTASRIPYKGQLY